MSKAQQYALTVLAAPELKYDQAGVAKLTAAIGVEFQAIRQLQREDAARFTILGSMLLRLKHSLPARGGFQAVAQKIICDATGWTPATALKNASLAMRLAMTFIEKAKVSKPDLLALPGDQLTLDVGDNHPAQRFLSKLSTFVGELTRTELLIKHGLTGVGLKTELTDGNGDESGDELTDEQRAQFAREQAWLETWTATQQLRASLTEPDKLQLISDPKHFEQLKAEVVELNKLIDEHIATASAVKV
jgi:hypothetical protein